MGWLAYVSSPTGIQGGWKGNPYLLLVMWPTHGHMHAALYHCAVYSVDNQQIINHAMWPMQSTIDY